MIEKIAGDPIGKHSCQDHRSAKPDLLHRGPAQPVDRGRDYGATVEIIRGLAPQDRLVNSPPNGLQEGSAVRIAKAAPATATTPAAAPASAVPRRRLETGARNRPASPRPARRYDDALPN